MKCKNCGHELGETGDHLIQTRDGKCGIITNSSYLEDGDDYEDDWTQFCDCRNPMSDSKESEKE